MLERDNVVYMGPVEDGTSPVEKYSYLGKYIFWLVNSRNIHTVIDFQFKNIYTTKINCKIATYVI